jgi:tRNA(Arg) A34 adenosine deaminase TadA
VSPRVEFERPWDTAFELAWQAYCAGTIPVGAVLTESSGAVLASGRNRVFESSAPEGQVFGSRLAHAEINTLVKLGTARRYFDCTLWTTLEPCAQCVAAAWLSTVGRLCFAAFDVYSGAARLIERELEATEAARRFPLAVEGPLGGVPALLGEVLPIAFFLKRDPHDHVSAVYLERRPQLVRFAEELRLDERRGRPFAEVLRDISDELITAAARLSL